LQKEWFLDGLDPNMRYVIEDKLPANLAVVKMIIISIEERLIRVRKVRPLTFIIPKEEKEVTSL